MFQRNGFAQPDRRAAADRDTAVGAQRDSPVAGLVCHLDRDMHASLCQEACGAVPECIGDQLAGVCLFG